ncbi:DUF6226 family protein [Agromyces italicus]|uniref:DUF6226 family protein n=1 Tax=Agromyces italicus TaxID=279572 RepID=UPI0003B73B95|nr:DUF6226 family protein [Agromyces italicus]
MDVAADAARWGASSGIDELEWVSRWGVESPPTESYSRVTDAERYRVLQPFALAVLDDLERVFDVERDELTGLSGGTADHVDLERVVRLVPADPASGPLTVGLTSLPGLLLRFGEHTDLVLPRCGCDACDELVQELRDALRFRVEALVTGRFAESGAADGSAWHRFVTETGSSAGSSSPDAAGPGPHPVYDHEWSAWRRRA